MLIGTITADGDQFRVQLIERVSQTPEPVFLLALAPPEPAKVRREKSPATPI